MLKSVSIFSLHYLSVKGCAHFLSLNINWCLQKTKTQTLMNNFSVVFHRGCPKFCVELCEPPKNLKKDKKEKIVEEKEEKKVKKSEGGVCSGQHWSQKIHLDKRMNICSMHLLSKHPLVAKKWRQSLKNMIFAHFPSFYKGILKQNSAN